MHITGIDLSGPANTRDTSLVWLERRNGRLALLQSLNGAGDLDILDAVSALASQGDVVVGIDAPLSYNPGGGDRPGDADLRRQPVQKGLHPGCVMAPTMPGMVYLTLRGISIARALHAIRPRAPKIVEIHPTVSMALRGALIEHVSTYKHNVDARQKLLAWLVEQGLEDVAGVANPSDHFVAACACALAAWKWFSEDAVWLTQAEPPLHPFDFAC